jgi:hypothetical protein
MMASDEQIRALIEKWENHRQLMVRGITKAFDDNNEGLAVARDASRQVLVYVMKDLEALLQPDTAAPVASNAPGRPSTPPEAPETP